MRAITVAVLVSTSIIAAPGAAHAEEVLVKHELKLNLSALLQPQALVAEAGAPDGSAGTDFFVRRARLMLHGNLTSRIAFFVDTEQANLGKDGDWSTSVFLQDAFVSLSLVPEVQLDAGMMLVPLTRHVLQSAVSLNAIDYHGTLIAFPTGSTRTWRDVGVQSRASLVGGKILLRGGVFNGVEGVAADADTETMERNTGDLPRIAGHARLVILGNDDGFFFPGIRFADTPTVSVGVGADWQHQAIARGDGPADHLIVAADLFAELPTTTDQAVVVQVTALRYDDGAGAVTTGLGGFVEAGYRIGRIEPIVAAELFASEADADAGDFLGLHAGAAVFLDKHRSNIKVDVARTTTAASAPVLSAALQAQLSF